MNKGYEIDARVPSILIAGGSNFPTRKKEKQNAARDSNYREWQDIQGLLDKIRSTGMGGISADDPQAVQKLEKKLESLEKSQETMKAVNAYYRKHKTLDGCPHLLPEQLEKLKADMASSWHLGDKPFATWALSNNSAEIRRVKDRIKSLSQQKEIGFVGWEFDGGKVEANTEANRLQIFFEDKPDEATREALKSNGFRWSPKAGAWQRQLTSNAYYAADYVKAIAPLTGEKPTELQRAHIRAQKVAAQEQFAQGQPEQEAPQDKDTFSIYQIKGGDETRDLRFEPYDRLIAAGHRVDAKNYTLVYSAPLTPGTSLEDIYTRFNIDHPKDFKGHSLAIAYLSLLFLTRFFGGVCRCSFCGRVLLAGLLRSVGLRSSVSCCSRRISFSSSRTDGRSSLAVPSADLFLDFEEGSDGRDFSVRAAVGFSWAASCFCAGAAIISSSSRSSSLFCGRSCSGAVCPAASLFLSRPVSAFSRMTSGSDTVAILMFSTMRLILAASSARTMISLTPCGLSFASRRTQ